MTTTMTLNQMLRGRNLTGLVQGIRSGLPTILPEIFLTPTRNIKGDLVEWFEVRGVRDVARQAHYGGPAHARTLEGMTRRSATMIHSFEHQSLPVAAWPNLTHPETGNAQDMARQEIERQTRAFKQRFVNLRQAATACAISTGRLYFDDQGQLLPAESGSVWGVDFNIPPSNRGKLVASDGIIQGSSAKWSAGGTDILWQLRLLKSLAARTTGYPLAYAFYGAHIPTYLAGNEGISNWIHSGVPSTGETAEAVMQGGELPGNLFGLKWIPMADAFFASADGTLHNVHDPDTVVFTPAPSPDWFELIQGSYAVPTGAPTEHDGDSLEEVFGMFSYATLEHNPPSLVQYAGDTFLPLIKVPGAVFHAQVHW
ncbi:MAG: major capsid protein [Phycisphaeraceae bacterium]|nr:major capsid protein [Phycisphaeraceae bacterium]